jgi:hypothetical protein
LEVQVRMLLLMLLLLLLLLLTMRTLFLFLSCFPGAIACVHKLSVQRLKFEHYSVAVLHENQSIFQADPSLSPTHSPCFFRRRWRRQ